MTNTNHEFEGLNKETEHNSEIADIKESTNRAIEKAREVQGNSRDRVKNALAKGLAVGAVSAGLTYGLGQPIISGIASGAVNAAYEQESGQKLNSTSKLGYTIAGAFGLGFINPYTYHALSH